VLTQAVSGCQYKQCSIAGQGGTQIQTLKGVRRVVDLLERPSLAGATIRSAVGLEKDIRAEK